MSDQKTKIFGIGISGLVGSRIAEVLRDQYSFDNLSLDTGVDITKPESLDIIRNDKDHPIVLHLAAKADVDGCEQDKALGEKGQAYLFNVFGTQNVVEACKESGKKIIYISTDFVFDGEKLADDAYTEEDAPHPGNWYAQTKYLGEEVVKNAGIPFLITRIAYPYRSDDFAAKKDFVHAILGRLKEGLPVVGVTDHIMTPTYLDDIAYALDALVQHDAEGIYHLVGSGSVTPYDAAMLIAQKFDLDKSLISKTTRAEFFRGRADRPFNLRLNNDKITELGVKMRSFEEGLEEIA
jgi:dTDP-4-dehydrorhamnose reductase